MHLGHDYPSFMHMIHQRWIIRLRHDKIISLGAEGKLLVHHPVVRAGLYASDAGFMKDL